MSFMQPQIVFDEWYEVETDDGMTFLPVDDVGYDSRRRIINGYGARLSAPGYLDCTEWTVFDTEKEAREFLKETYDVED